jgi:hypothetical protein
VLVCMYLSTDTHRQTSMYEIKEEKMNRGRVSLLHRWVNMSYRVYTFTVSRCRKKGEHENSSRLQKHDVHFFFFFWFHLPHKIACCLRLIIFCFSLTPKRFILKEENRKEIQFKFKIVYFL